MINAGRKNSSRNPLFHRAYREWWGHDPNDAAGKPKGKTVMDILISKHPDQEDPDKKAFIECKELLVFLDVNVTASHVGLRINCLGLPGKVV